MTIRDSSIAQFTQALSARSATPGGGSAAAITAALGLSAGAMAARYTTGPKWGNASEHALTLITSLENATTEALRLADDDVTSFAAVQQARKDRNAEAIALAEHHAASIPAQVIALCAHQAGLLHAFIKICNPQLVSDVAVAIQLLSGAGRAAWHTLLVNNPKPESTKTAQTHIDELKRYEDAAMNHSAGS